MATVERTPDERRDPIIRTAEALSAHLDQSMHLFEGGAAVEAVLWAWLNDELLETSDDLFYAIQFLAGFHRPGYLPHLAYNDEGERDSVEWIHAICIKIAMQAHRALDDTDTDNALTSNGEQLTFPVRYARIAALEIAHDDLGRAIDALKADAAANGD